jgi:hypothetical protein
MRGPFSTDSRPQVATTTAVVVTCYAAAAAASVAKVTAKFAATTFSATTLPPPLLGDLPRTGTGLIDPTDERRPGTKPEVWMTMKEEQRRQH